MSLFDYFDVETFYTEIQSRLNRTESVKLQPGTTIIHKGRIVHAQGK